MVERTHTVVRVFTVDRVDLGEVARSVNLSDATTELRDSLEKQNYTPVGSVEATMISPVNDHVPYPREEAWHYTLRYQGYEEPDNQSGRQQSREGQP